MHIKIGTIPEADFYEYRLDIMFDGYKWDSQAGEQSTISNKAILLGQAEMQFLSDTAVLLAQETVAMEQALKSRVDLMLELGVSEKLAHALYDCDYQPVKHIRMMRFDFHPTADGWQISEVNSDVPAGYPEASVLPQLAEKYFDGYKQHGDLSKALADRLEKLAPAESAIAYLHDTHTVDDYQIVHLIGDEMARRGFRSVYADPAHIQWADARARDIGAILRHYPMEWLEFVEGADWLSFVNSKTPSCNHPLALLAQSKRLPLVWDELHVTIPTWKKMLPATVCPTAQTPDAGWILKPAFGRVGEGINIPGTVSPAENKEIKNAAAACPTQWVKQRMFESVPIEGLHLCLGVFVVDGQFSGIFGRTSKTPKMDADVSEVPVLVKEAR